ncbi:MAG: hydrogenase maturation nickel metallochaperone HypA [Planctomycetia bacterium]|nr:hydrogenase maturation nickel metallochaperone HypA [Planctomycetia bacterium]
MHELSLVRSLLAQVNRIRSDRAGLAVDGVHVEVGPLSGVEPELLVSAFEQLAGDFGMTGTQLVIDEVPLMANCPSCGTVTVEPVRIRCPICGDDGVTIVSGDEVRLQSVTIQCPEPEEQAL